MRCTDAAWTLWLPSVAIAVPLERQAVCLKQRPRRGLRGMNRAYPEVRSFPCRSSCKNDFARAAKSHASQVDHHGGYGRRGDQDLHAPPEGRLPFFPVRPVALGQRKTKSDFFRDEQAALEPFQRGY